MPGSRRRPSRLHRIEMTSAFETYVAEAERAAAGRRTDPGWLAATRRRGLETFCELGFPTPRDEDWRFTSVAPIAQTPFVHATNGVSLVGPGHLDRFQWLDETVATLVFINGRYVASASHLHRVPTAVKVGSLANAVAEPGNDIETHLAQVATPNRHAFTALNTAFLADGGFISVPESVVLGAPIHLLFVSTGDRGRPAMAHPRVLILMGANSQASVVESYVGVGASRYFANTVTEIVTSDHSRLDHYKLQQEAIDSAHMGGMYINAARTSTVTCHSISLGGSFVRNDIVVTLNGSGAECTLNGLYFADRRTLVDNHTTIDHAQPHCSSRELYKGILGDHARAVFNGKIVVRPDAQKTDAKQTNKALLLSEDAQINTKPQLEIFANDVRCTHGAAVGQMDDEALFYLRARGLSEQDARRILIKAFAGDVLNRLPLVALATRLDQELMLRLPRGGA
jgi:Fe-S cluster assembly protein SufD